MPATPKRRGENPPAGRQLLAEVLGDNIRAARSRERLTQEDVAERMRFLGHPTWSRTTVSNVEKGERSLTVEELVGLGFAVGAKLNELLNPYGRMVWPRGGPVEAFIGGHVRVRMHPSEDGFDLIGDEPFIDVDALERHDREQAAQWGVDPTDYDAEAGP